MIKVDHIEVFNWGGAIRGMRNPLNSHDKSDSFSVTECGLDINGEIMLSTCRIGHKIGEADLALMRKLCRAGSDHRKFLRQILVSMDITAPLYWWKEWDTYKVGTVANSCSTMHTIHKKPFELDDFSHDRIAGEYLESLNLTIATLNYARRRYLETEEKCHWNAMIQLLPSSYNQRRTLTLNYEVLLNMYHARHNHKLPEWRTFCEIIPEMPYFREICLSEESNNA